MYTRAVRPLHTSATTAALSWHRDMTGQRIIVVTVDSPSKAHAIFILCKKYPSDIFVRVRTCQRSLCTSITSLDGSDLGTVRNFLCRFRFGGVASESTDVRTPFAVLSVRSTSLLSLGRGVTSPSVAPNPPVGAFDCKACWQQRSRRNNRRDENRGSACCLDWSTHNRIYPAAAHAAVLLTYSCILSRT